MGGSGGVTSGPSLTSPSFCETRRHQWAEAPGPCTNLPPTQKLARQSLGLPPHKRPTQLSAGRWEDGESKVRWVGNLSAPVTIPTGHPPRLALPVAAPRGPATRPQTVCPRGAPSWAVQAQPLLSAHSASAGPPPARPIPGSRHPSRNKRASLQFSNPFSLTATSTRQESQPPFIGEDTEVKCPLSAKAPQGSG